MAEVVLVSTSRSVDEESVRFEVRCYLRYAAPFVVLAPGDDDTRLTVSDPAHLVALGRAVAEVHDLLAAAVAGQDPLPDAPAGLSA